MSQLPEYLAIVIGASAGGTEAVFKLLNGINKIFPPIIVVQHRFKDEKNLLEENLQKKIKIRVKQADEKENISESMVYIAPPDYHLQVERDERFSLSCDPPVNYSRPSIDVLFETASEVYKEHLAGIILTGANEDGANGIRSVYNYGGLTIAQDPGEALFPSMPAAAIQTGAVRKILPLKEINKFLIEISRNEEYKRRS